MTQKRNREAFLYILPCLVVLGFFVYYPLVMNLIYFCFSKTFASVRQNNVFVAACVEESYSVLLREISDELVGFFRLRPRKCGIYHVTAYAVIRQAAF